MVILLEAKYNLLHLPPEVNLYHQEILYLSGKPFYYFNMVTEIKRWGTRRGFRLTSLNALLILLMKSINVINNDIHSISIE